MNITLDTEISKINRLTKDHSVALNKLKINTIRDLLFYFPTRYLDERENSSIQNLNKGASVILYGEIKSLKIKRSFKGHVPMCEAKLFDMSGSVRLVWFHQAYIAKMYQEDDFVKISGVVSEKEGVFSILNPNIEKASRDHIFFENSILENINLKDENIKEDRAFEIIPIYKETKGLTSNYLSSLIKKVILEHRILDQIKNEDPIPKHVLDDFHLPAIDKALLYVHIPKGKNKEEAEKQILGARKRFSFEEVFYIQILKQIEREKAKDSLAYKVSSSKEILDNLLKDLNIKFKLKLTGAQENAIKVIFKDLEKDEPMSRLLEGDVGSGKTLVAEIATYLVTHNLNRDKDTNKKLQVAYMAPTEILATQHFESFCSFFKDSGIEIGLLTSKTCKKFPSRADKNKATNISKNQLKKWISSGDISILIGTHSLIGESVAFQNLALAIIDEQHRFGVRQRAALANKKSSSTTIIPANDLRNLSNKKQKIVNHKEKLPHLLSMTATPIPRTLALTIFGDLDLVILDELPKGRKPISTFIETEVNREKVYNDLKKEIESGYQAYVITPRIDELDEEDMQKARALNLRSTTSELKNLEEFFNKKENMNINIKAIHSKLKKEEKESIMQDFANGKIKILVSTSIVEVGVNVPNASRMIIEGGERFGLAQLHQLRGRIGRGERESVCYLFTNSNSEITAERLSALKKAKNGFELAELDLNQRGIGSLLSGKQWGMSDLAMEAIKNLKLVEAAREEAKKIAKDDKDLKKHPLLSKILLEKEKVHME
ncbi:MAG: ATP-dependent DNA helicase RecG [Candidatus Pacebacteria bacterium]|nr:ATP-dependent DNA helicase RecG [Candidatus Paceibacterota bacterium]